MAIRSQGMWTPRVWQLLQRHYPGIDEEIVRYEGDPGLFMKDLRSLGIDKCVLLAEDSNETGIVPNDYILEYSREHPDFFVPFLALNPNRINSFRGNPAHFSDNVLFCRDRLEGIAETGFRGIKDYGSYNHVPFGTDAMLPFYERASEQGLPVLFHTGVSMFDSERSRVFADPGGLGALAAAIPDLRIIIGHCGGGAFFGRAYELALSHPNIYLEFSGVPPHLLEEHFFEKGLDLNLIPGKIIFGSDYPALPNGLSGIGKNIETYEKMGESGLLTEETVRGLLGLNAMGILSGG